MNAIPRIAIASSGLGHVARGIEAWAEDLGLSLHQQIGHILVCKGGGSQQHVYERIVPCWTRESMQTQRLLRRLPRSIGWRLGLGSGYGIEQTTFAWNLLSILRRERIDILHVQDPQVALLMQRAKMLKLIGTRTILAHGTEESAEFLQQIDYVQHLAPWHLEDAKASGVWKPTWTAIPNFIDTARFVPGRSPDLRRELNIPAEGFVVLSAAALKRHHKRVDYVLEEFRLLRARYPDLPLWLILAGGWEADTDALVQQGTLALGERVKFLVRFPRSRMAELYRAADVFTIGSLKEMMPIALLEATASGLPCVVHHHPVMSWMVGSGGAAIDMSQTGMLAATLGLFAQDVGRSRHLGQLAREHCVANFSRDRVVNDILAYYQIIMNKRIAPGTSSVDRGTRDGRHGVLQ
jgi:1,2-diacylglycerol 3-alpha-glucosyltransferase